MTPLSLTHKIGRVLLICAFAGLVYTLFRMYQLDVITPYGIQSILFFNAFVVFLSLVYLEKSPRVLHWIAGIVALFSISLSALCYFNHQLLPVYWNFIFLSTATVITLTMVERLRKKRGTFARLSLALCLLTLFALGFILLTKNKGEFIHPLFMLLAIGSTLLAAIAVVFYGRRDQSTKVP